MLVEIQLFGAFRDFEHSGKLSLDVAEDSDVAQLRAAIDAYGSQHWGEKYRPGLLRVSAFASDQRVLRETDKINDHQGLAVLPPVSGG